MIELSPPSIEAEENRVVRNKEMYVKLLEENNCLKGKMKLTEWKDVEVFEGERDSAVSFSKYTLILQVSPSTLFF